MFTSRAEHRLLLGCDSVYERLTPIARALGVVDDERLRRAEARVARMNRAERIAGATTLTPDRDTQAWWPEITSQTTVAKLMQRPDFSIDRFVDAAPLPQLVEAFRAMTEEERDAVVNELRYSGYIERQQREAGKAAADEEARIPPEMTFTLPGLSREVVEKLSAVRPASLGQASRIPGVTPAAISVLRMHLRRRPPMNA
jgi:tRNA uridine 5-carboxymethylaminomethyl modification enzyme